MNHPSVQFRRPPVWEGRDDGPGPEHARWHNLINRAEAPIGLEPGELLEAQPAGASGTPGPVPPVRWDLIGFASDAGVARNKGRVGAAEGPDELRRALSSLAPHRPVRLTDRGTIAVLHDDGLESGQDALAEAVASSVAAGAVPCVLGGGHETAWGTFRGLHGGMRERQKREGSSPAGAAPRLGILNLDQHFDLREEPVATSGTPFRQIASYLGEHGEEFRYAVLGLSEPNNTAAGFATARELGVRVLLDERCQSLPEPQEFTERFLAEVDAVYLTLDLDVLPAAAAPGVSAPAAYGVPVDVVRSVMRQVAASGKLIGMDVVELNPAYDQDARTARTAARLIQDTLAAFPSAGEQH